MAHTTELHLHDYYSTLDGLSSPEEYMLRAKELGMTHLAQTNHGTLGGVRHFQTAAKEAGIVPIIGMEAYISPTDRFDKRSRASRAEGDAVYNHIILLAQHQQGLETLYRLNEKAYTEGFYQKPRIDLDLLEEDNSGLIVLSGCLNSLICKAISNNDPERAFKVASDLKDILGDRFYMELQVHNGAEMNHALLDIADKLGIAPVTTSDCHYANKEDLWIEEALLILSTSPKVNSDFDFSKAQKMETLERFNYLYPDRKMTFQEIEIYLRSYAEQQAGYAQQGIERTDLLDNTNVIASRIGEYEFYEGLDLLPSPVEEDPDEYLEKQAWVGMKRLGLDKKPEYVARLNEELAIIKDKKFSTYFIVVSDAIQWAKGQGILVGPGRGSAAGSLLCYALDITTIDPIEYKLLFMRFINPERNDFPDIDVDIEDKRRPEVQDYIRRTYPYSGNIATVTRFTEKRPIKDAARVYKVPLGEVNQAVKFIETFEDFKTSPTTAEFRNKYPEVEKLASQLIGRVANRGMHAAGMVVSKEPLSKYAPIETAKDTTTGERVPLLAYDMRDAADIGFIKMDWLGLKDLTVIQHTIQYVKERHGIDIVLKDIPLNDRKVYKMLSDGFTKGIPQCGGAPYTSLILKIGGVWSFDELSASNALVRPGAMDSIGAEYIERKSGKVPVKYYHPDMEDFTKDTYGEILYQEQVMLTMTELAGMSMATADKVRKLIGKKEDVSKFQVYKEEFVDGASAKVTKAVAEKLWKDFEAHANYSFNKSHAVAYSTLSYWAAWLKVNYPTEFMTALLSNEKDKDSITEYLIEAKRMGLKIRLPHVNRSKASFSIEGDGAIRFGLQNIKQFSETTAQRLINLGPYESYKQLEDTIFTKGSGLSSRQLASLNAVGAAVFDDHPLTGKERENYYEYLKIPAFSNALSPSMKAQMLPINEYIEGQAALVMGLVKEIKVGKGWALVSLLDETGSMGIFTTQDTPIEVGKQYAMILGNKNIIKYINVADIPDEPDHAIVKHLSTPVYADLTDDFVKVVAVRAKTTKAGKRMADLIFADTDKNLAHALVFPGNFMKVYSACKEGESLSIQFGRTEDGALFVNNV